MHQPALTCINGRFVPASEAMLPIADRGFRFGDGVFETIRLIRGVPYQWELHMRRLEAGLAALRITPPIVDWQASARTLIQRNSVSEGYLRIAVSRGVGSKGYLPDADITANWVIETLPPTTPEKEACTLWLSSLTRPSPENLPAQYKLAQGIGSTLALLEARDHGADDALMLSGSGHVSEAASGNLFWLKGDTLFTPALTTGCLMGTTRAAIMRLFEVVETHAGIEDFLSADAAFLCNVRHGIWPIASLMPHAKTYDTRHARLLEIAAALEADRSAYTTLHTAQWA